MIVFVDYVGGVDEDGDEVVEGGEGDEEVEFVNCVWGVKDCGEE